MISALLVCGLATAQADPVEAQTPDPPELVPVDRMEPVRPKAKYWAEVPMTRTSQGRMQQVVECTFAVQVSERGKVTEVASLGCPEGFEKAGLKAAKYWRFEPWPTEKAPEATWTEVHFRWVRNP